MGRTLADLIATLAALGLHDPQVTQPPLVGPLEPHAQVAQRVTHMARLPVLNAAISEGQHVALTPTLGKPLSADTEVFAKACATGFELVDRNPVIARFHVVDTGDKPPEGRGSAHTNNDR